VLQHPIPGKETLWAVGLSLAYLRSHSPEILGKTPAKTD
jgi:uncharacterized membrane protein YhdT